jgi:hypothetical protein
MPAVEKVSIALTPDMLAMIRRAVDSGDYASSSEVVRDALRQWKAGRLVIDGTAESSARSPPIPDVKAAKAPAGSLLEPHREAIVKLCRRHGVRRLGIFGSALRPDFDPAQSDIDMVVEFADVPGHSPARQYFDFKAALEQQLARPVDLVELATMPTSRLRRTLERTQVLFYAEAA